MVYHGTSREKADKIIADNAFKISVGDRHWLGDGVYFYKDLPYALRWIRCMHEKDFEEIDSLMDQYSIVEAVLNVQEDRKFSFLNLVHERIFQSVMEACKEKLNTIVKDGRVVDGAVLNIMFKKMKYGEEYDVVEAVFLHEDRNKLGFESRLFYVPEIQICVKNTKVIEQIRIRKILQEELTEHMSIIDRFKTISSGVLQKKNITYSNQKGRYRMR